MPPLVPVLLPRLLLLVEVLWPRVMLVFLLLVVMRRDVLVVAATVCPLLMERTVCAVVV